MDKSKTKNRIRNLLLIALPVFITVCFGFAQNALAADYHATGTLISTNLLKGIPNDSIDSFFASSTIATGTSLWVQFATTSADGPWYDASSTLDATTSIPAGQQTIPLSGAITSGGANFYYKIQFNSDGSDTPVLTQIKVNYTADTYITPTTYYNLESSPAVTSTHILGTSTEQTITINNDFTVGDGTNQVTVTASSTNPTLSIGSNFTINAAGTFVAPTSSSFTIAGNWTNSGTFTHSEGTVVFDTTATSTISGATTFYNFTSTSSNKTLAFEKQAESIADYYDIDAGIQRRFNSSDLVRYGQSFESKGRGALTMVKFFLKKVGNPTGNFTAKLFAHSGTYGTSSIGTGDPLAVSDNVDISNIPADVDWVEFPFSGENKYGLQPNTYYVIVLENNQQNCDFDNYIEMPFDDGYYGGPHHAGNYVRYAVDSWFAEPDKDNLFIVIRVNPVFTFVNDFIITGTGGNLINIRSDTPGTQWFPYFEKDQGTYATPTVAYAHIQDSGGATGSQAVYLDSTSEKGDNVDTDYWKWEVVGEITVSGIIYTDEAKTSPYDCSADPLVIGVSVNGTSTATTSCTLATGAYSRNVDPPESAGDPVVVFIDSTETPKATTATLAVDTLSSIENLHLFIDRVSITHESAGPMTNAKLAAGDNSDAGIRYSTSNGSLSIESGLKLLIRADKTFTPGGTVTTSVSASSTLPGGDLGIQTGAVLNMGTNALSVGGNYLNSGTFSWSPEQTTTFTATAAGHTVTDGGYAFNVIVFNGSGGGWLYQDSTSTAPATTTVQAGIPTFLNAKTGAVDVQGGTLNVDWYLGTHVVAAFSTSIDIENATATISEETASSTVWKMSESSWGSASTSQWTVTDAGGKNPQPTSNGAIRIREYSNTAGTAAYYKYNLTIVVSSGYSPYDYYLDHGSKYIASASSADGDVDAVISQDWHRETVSQMNTPYSSVNEPPTNGSWYAGMSSDLEFSVDSATVNFVSLTGINKLTATATTMLYATTSFPGGYTITSFAANDGKLATSTYSIPRLDAGNASPVEWLGACWDSDHCGFGYNTDNLVRFNGNKYAGFATSTPGDPVAYESTDVPSGASYTITYKVSAPPTTTPETYKTVITYLAKVNY